MKKRKLIVLALVCALIVGALPMAAFAAKAQEFDVTVRNRTGQPAEVKVIGADGVPHMFTAPVGVSNITLPEGVQSYWVSSSCGNSAGSWNLNVNKTLWIDCTPLGNAAWVAKPALKACSDTGLFVFFGPDYVVYYSETNWDDYDRGSYYPYSQFFTEYIDGFEFYQFGCITEMNYNSYQIGPNTP